MLSKDVTVINGMVRTKDSIKMKDKIVNYRGQMIDVGAGSMGDWSSICSIPGNPTNPIGAWGKTEQEAIENIKPKIDKVLSNKTKDQDNEKIEGYGVKGNNNDKWRRIFSNRAEMMKWVESNNAEIQGTRKAEPNERVGNVDKKTKDDSGWEEVKAGDYIALNIGGGFVEKARVKEVKSNGFLMQYEDGTRLVPKTDFAWIVRKG